MKLQLKSGLKTVTTAGTRVALASSDTWAIGLQLCAPAANSGVVYLGDVTVASTNGRVIAAGGVVSFTDLMGVFHNEEHDYPMVNLKDTYVDAATNGDKITFSYFQIVRNNIPS